MNDKYDDAGILIRPIVKLESEMNQPENEQLRKYAELEALHNMESVSPIPAQQSPAVAVQYQSAVSGVWYSNPNAAGEISRVKVNGELFVVDSGSQSPRITEQDDNLAALVVQELYSNGGAHESQIEKARRIIGFISSRLPDRVTEQDARKIIYSFSDNCSQGDFRYWINEKGRALLAKLNKPDSVGG